MDVGGEETRDPVGLWPEQLREGAAPVAGLVPLQEEPIGGGVEGSAFVRLRTF